MKRYYFVKVIVAVATACIATALWWLQPWMPPDSAIKLGQWTFDEVHCEVWQRKNHSIGEPFATGLFVRVGTNRWSVVCLDHQDIYRPSINLGLSGDSIEIKNGSRTIGEYSLVQCDLKRPHNTNLYHAAIVNERPPGRWWLRAE